MTFDAPCYAAGIMPLTILLESTAWVPASLLLLAACHGPGPDASNAGPIRPTTLADGGQATEASAPADPGHAGSTELRRLTWIQYTNTLRDLLGVDPKAMDTLIHDPLGSSGFQEASVLSTDDLRKLMEVTETAVSSVTGTLVSSLPCDVAADEPSCVAKFIAAFGERAFRRALSSTEAEDLLDLFTSMRKLSGYHLADALRVVIEAMLQAPEFLYQWRHDCSASADRATDLCSYDVASRLSYFLWNSMPDPQLLARAARRELSDPAVIESEARRMIGDPRVKDAIGWFYRELLDLGPFEPDLAPNPTTRSGKVPYVPYSLRDQADLVRSMDRETWEFTTRVITEGDARLETIMSAPFSFVDERLSKFYGAAAPVAGSDFLEVQLEHRWGLLSQASFLWIYAGPGGTNPTKRGKEVFERILCGQIPDPPPNVPAERSASTGGSTRERFAEHATMACAKACHSLMDPIGFAFESFDHMGRYQTTDAGEPVDTSGTVTFPIDGEQTFANTLEFIQALTRSQDLRRCATRQWFRFAMDRRETPGDARTLDGLYDTFARSYFDLRELMVAIATSPAFLRQLSSGGR
jgi:hypothetical protein